MGWGCLLFGAGMMTLTVGALFAVDLSVVAGGLLMLGGLVMWSERKRVRI